MKEVDLNGSCSEHFIFMFKGVGTVASFIRKDSSWLLSLRQLMGSDINLKNSFELVTKYSKKKNFLFIY